VQADSNTDCTDLAPVLPGQRALGLERGAKGVADIVECGAEGIADNLEYAPAVLVDRGLHQGMVTRQRDFRAFRMPLDQARRAFDIGEQEGNGTAGKAVHAWNGGRA